jgi:hypothetical protein
MILLVLAGAWHEDVLERMQETLDRNPGMMRLRREIVRGRKLPLIGVPLTCAGAGSVVTWRPEAAIAISSSSVSAATEMSCLS